MSIKLVMFNLFHRERYMHNLYSLYSKCHVGVHAIPHNPKLSIPELYNFRLTTYDCPLEQGWCDAESEYYNSETY